MEKFKKGSTIKDYCDHIKKYVGKYVVVKTLSKKLYEGWLDECIEHPESSDDIMLRISTEDGVLLTERFGIKFIFEAVYGYDDECVSSPNRYIKNEM